MRVDIDSLDLTRRLAHDGAEHAADALAKLTGVETRVETTNVTLLSRASSWPPWTNCSSSAPRRGLTRNRCSKP